MISPSLYLSKAYARLNSVFGQGLVISISAIVFAALVVGAGILAYINSAAPTALTISSGPPGSVFERNAQRYQKILAREGVTLHVQSSQGSVDNLKRLLDPKGGVDVGFVLGGEVNGANVDSLLSLGSVSYQPLMVFYRGTRRNLLSDFKGQRLDIGEEGSGTHILAQTLLQANGITAEDGTVLVNSVKGGAVKSLLENRVDAIFVMGDSTAGEMMHTLLHTANLHLFNFTQADAYVRRIAYLNKLELPRGALDLGNDTPTEDINLLAPTVELVARDTLHPALSDVLLAAAKEVHSTPGLFKKRGEFPAALEHEFRISADATRFYTSGKSFLYRTFPFWLASLIARTLAVVVPLALLLIPALKMAPAIYRWRIESKINRWYKALLDLERDADRLPSHPDRHRDIQRRLDHIEHVVSRITVPASFGDILYGLRGHINIVRDSLLARDRQDDGH